MTICQVAQYDNPAKDVVGIHLNVEGRDLHKVFDNLYDLMKKFYHIPEIDQFLDGPAQYEKGYNGSLKGRWFYRVCHDFEEDPKTHRVKVTDIDFRIDLVYLGMQNVSADSPEGLGRAFSKQRFGLYFKDPGDGIDLRLRRDFLRDYLKSHADDLVRETG